MDLVFHCSPNSLSVNSKQPHHYPLTGETVRSLQELGESSLELQTLRAIHAESPVSVLTDESMARLLKMMRTLLEKPRRDLERPHALE